MKLKNNALRARLRDIQLVLTDVDGVMTDGMINHFIDTNGELVEFKAIHSVDSIAMAWLAENGFNTGVISGRISKGTEARLKLLKVKYIYQHRLDKKTVLDEILSLEKIDRKRVLYMGDDLPDLAVMSRVGVAVAPATARPEVKSAVHWVTKAPAGQGAFREMAELLLKAQQKWEIILDRFN